MINLSQKGYTSEQVLECLHYKNSTRNVFYKYALLDRQDREIGRFANIEGGNIKMQVFSTLNRQGTFIAAEEEGIDYLKHRIQPRFCLRIGDIVLEYPLGVFVISSPKRILENGVVRREMQCFDKSILLTRDYFNDVYYIPEGTNYINEVHSIIGTVGIRGISIPDKGSVTNRALEFEAEASKMEIINELLKAVNYTPLHFDERGFAVSSEYVLPSERQAEIFYQTDNSSIVSQGAAEELDIFNIPNVFRAIYTNPETQESMTAVFENHDPQSAVSIENIGWRNVAPTYRVDDIDSQDSLYALVRRNAYLSIDKFNKVTFSTATVPMHDYYNCIFMRHDELSILGNFLESSWEINLSPSGKMLHEIRRQITI